MHPSNHIRLPAHAAFLALGVAAISAASAFAQAAGRAPIGPYYPPTYTYGSSTLEEGVARGLADVVRSAGAANLMHSEAAKSYEEARAKYFDNRLRATQTYFEMRQLNQEYRAAERGQRPTAEQLFRISQMRLPAQLTPSELDPYSGEVHWPTLLLASDYAESRVLVEALMRKRAADVTSLTVDDRAALRAAIDALAAQMQANISVYDPNEYMAARNFLESLAYTTGVGGL